MDMMILYCARDKAVNDFIRDAFFGGLNDNRRERYDRISF